MGVGVGGGGLLVRGCVCVGGVLFRGCVCVWGGCYLEG